MATNTNITNDDDIKVYYEVRIKQPVANVYRDDSKTNIVGYTYEGYDIIATEVSQDKKFYYFPAYEGWIEASNFTIVDIIVPEGVDPNVIKGVVNTKNITQRIVDTNSIVGSGNLATMGASDLNGVFAIPYQFMPSVDRRLNNQPTGVGRKYAEKILSRNNLLYLQPGEPEFLPGSSSSNKAAGLSSIASGESAGIGGINGRFYTFRQNITDYFRYVNAAAHATASLMGIENQSITINGRTATAGHYDWSNALSNTYSRILNCSKNMVFYMDSYNQVSEDFGNSTRESSLVSQINGLSDTTKEINFLMGTAMASAGMEDVNATFSSIEENIRTFTSGHGVLNALLGNVTTVLAGGKIIFPEIWSDSDYDRSYNIDIKLRSPEADEMSIYLNIIIPYIHLMALTAPRDFREEGAGGVEGYKAPFLVRAFVRSMFNIDLGIITGLSITKGGEGNWSVATNLPTSVDVSLTIKDLYKSLYVTEDDAFKFVTNDAELEQLMALAGVNYYELTIGSKIGLAGSIFGGHITSIPTTVRNRITDYIDRALRPFVSAR